MCPCARGGRDARKNCLLKLCLLLRSTAGARLQNTRRTENTTCALPQAGSCRRHSGGQRAPPPPPPSLYPLGVEDTTHHQLHTIPPPLASPLCPATLGRITRQIVKNKYQTQDAWCVMSQGVPGPQASRTRAACLLATPTMPATLRYECSAGDAPEESPSPVSFGLTGGAASTSTAASVCGTSPTKH